jgi:soluble lytic murein transglycosylase-like protein
MRSVNPHLAAPISRLYAAALLADAKRNRVDPTLVMAVVTVESHWNVKARSYRGAIGLGQLMPQTARNLGVDPTQGRSNIAGLTIYLHKLLSLFRDARNPIRNAIAGYNAGPLAVKRYGGVPPFAETRRYVVKVLAAWHGFKVALPSNPSALAVASQLSLAESVSKEQMSYWGAI